MIRARIHAPAACLFQPPARDRGYVVGKDGMVFRYSVVPSDYRSIALIDASAMPVLESPIDDELAALEDEVNALEKSLDEGGDAGEGDGASAESGEDGASSTVDASEPGSGGGAAGGSWSDGRFGKRLQKIEAELSAITSGIPALQKRDGAPQFGDRR